MGGRNSEDDDALLAMEASRMSLDSIAATMGWSRRRVETRLALLKARSGPAAERAAPVAGVAEIADHVAGAAQRRRLSRGLCVLVDGLPALAGVQLGRGLGGLAAGLPELGSVLVVQGMAVAVGGIRRQGAGQAASGLRALVDGLRGLPVPEVAPVPPPPAEVEPSGGRKPWSDEENALLRRIWPTTRHGQAERLTMAFDRTLDAIRSQAGKLDLGRMGSGAPPPPLRSERLRPRIAAPTPRLVDPFAVQTLKPLTERRLRYCGWFVRAGWSIEETAGLFDVSDSALAQALEAVH